MKNSEKLLLIVGSILGGFATIFGLYHAFKPETDSEELARTIRDNKRRFEGGKNQKARKRKRSTKNNKK